MKRSKRPLDDEEPQDYASAFSDRSSHFQAPPRSPPPSSTQVAPSPSPSPSPSRQSLCLLQVRSLNRQFVSWVQTQQNEHLDELWNEGVSHYLRHSDKIKDDFSDVVDWLSSKATNGGSPPQQPLKNATSAFPAKSVPIATSAFPATSSFPATSAPLATSAFPATSSFPATSAPLATSAFPAKSVPVATSAFPATSALLATSAFPVSASFGTSAPFPSSSPSPSLFPPPSTPSFLTSLNTNKYFGTTVVKENGDRGGGGGGGGAAGDEEEEEEKQPDSPSLKAREEEGVETIYEARVKLFLQGDKKEWKDMGVGTLTLKKYPPKEGGEGENSATRIALRNEGGRLLMNASLYKGITATASKKTIVLALYSTHEITSETDDKSSTPKRYLYLLKTGSEAKAEEISTTILNNAPK